MKMPEMPKMHIGIVIDQLNKKVVLASCGSDASEVIRKASDSFPGLPVHDLRLLDDPITVKERLFQFLAWNGIPEEKFDEILLTIVNGIRDSFNVTKEEISEDETA